MDENLFEHLSWDTTTFGYKVARILPPAISPADLKKLLTFLQEQDYKLAYWLVDPDNLFLNLFAEQAGALLADQKLTFTYQLSKNKLVETNTANQVISYFGTEPTADLLQLALQSGYYSRFKRDPNFRNNEYEKLYTAWLLHSLSKKIAREVLIYGLEDNIAGFITLAEKDLSGQIGLLAVTDTARRTGIAQQLLTAAVQLFSEWGCFQVQVNTQQVNRPAQAFYKKNNFILSKKVNVYHFWL